jgi:hypothetical protein
MCGVLPTARLRVRTAVLPDPPPSRPDPTRLAPIKKPTHRALLDWEKEFNKQINKIRYVIEQVIANFKTWRIMHTDYRRPLHTFAATISTVIALHFYKIVCE